METIENKIEPVFIENSVLPEYKSDIKWIEKVDPLPLTPFEINMNKGYITPEQLLQKEKEEFETPKQETDEEKEKRIKREYITKVKVIAIDKLGKHPLSNPSTFSTREKNKLIELMKEVMNQSDEDILKAFNEIVNNVLFAPESNYINYPTYKL